MGRRDDGPSADDAWEGFAVYPWDSAGDTRPLAVVRDQHAAQWFDVGPGSAEVRRVLVTLQAPGTEMYAERVASLEHEVDRLDTARDEAECDARAARKDLELAEQEHADAMRAAQTAHAQAVTVLESEIERLQGELAALRNAAPD